jgi:hypothetical protein
MLCSSCYQRPGKRMHLEGAAGTRPLCSHCAELRRERIRKNRLLASLHLDDDTEPATAVTRTSRTGSEDTSFVARSQPAQAGWCDASFTANP